MNDPTGMFRLVALSAAPMQREACVSASGAIIGRDGDQCDIVVSGRTISRRHLWIGRGDDGNWTVRDLDSTNGVYLDGARVERQATLCGGQIIGLGSPTEQHFRVSLAEAGQETGPIVLPASKRWCIGRAPDVDVRLGSEPTVSAYHAELQLADGGLRIRDLGSRNGTWINGEAVGSARTIEANDVVSLGAAELRFELLADQRLEVSYGDTHRRIGLQGVDLSLQINAGLGREPKMLLREITAAIEPGEFVGILGPSGAGKSTLLTTLNGYNPPTSGKVLLNDASLYKHFEIFRNIIGYVPQDDIIHHELIVRDSLHYIARLRLPDDVTNQQCADLVDTTIEDLGLGHVADQRISALSGGQRKRVSIGAELLTRPAILFLDEPTSGLDPSTEERLMRRFRDMTRRGTTTLITTHILYNLPMLDRVIILARGRLCFFGEPQEALSFFSPGKEPLERPTQIFDILEGERGGGYDRLIDSATDAHESLAEHFHARYRQSELFQRHVGDKLTSAAVEVADSATQQPADGRGEESSRRASRRGRLVKNPISVTAIATLVRRHAAIKLASLRAALFYLAVPVALALVTLSMSAPERVSDSQAQQRQQGLAEQINSGPPGLDPALKELLAPDTVGTDRSAADVVYSLKYEGVANLPVPVSVLIMCVMMAVFTGTLMACLEISSERHIFRREYMANQRIPDYLLSKLPFLFGLTAVQCGVFLAICCLRPEFREIDIVWTYLAILAMAWTACAIGLFLSAADPTRGQFSVVLAVVAVLPQLVLSGGLGPDYYAGMSILTAGLADALPARWGLSMLMTAAFDHPERAALGWIPDFVPDQMGFGFGSGEYVKGLSALGLQLVGWLVLCGAMIRYRCRPR